jgi:2-methylcitrate dehydratase
MNARISNVRPKPDRLLVEIAEYAVGYQVESREAMETARHCLLDSLGCALHALSYPACTKLLGPIVPGTIVPNGAKVPGTQLQLDPVKAAFDIGAMIRWLDFNDTWLAAEWGHPSDNLGGILAVADWLSRSAVAAGRKPLVMRDVLVAMVKAHELQGCLAILNSFNGVGLDHVVLVKLATTAVTSALLGLSHEQTVSAISQACVDGQALRTYRHAPNTGSRKSWAAADATSRGVRLAMIAQTGEMGYPSALTAATWGFYDVLFKGNAFKLQRPFGTYVMENVLFKVAHPAEFHAQTAIEAALMLHKQLSLSGQSDADIGRVVVRTCEASMRIISKSGPLDNPADRDHCLEYMIAVALIFGHLEASDYEEARSRDPRIDRLRSKIECREEHDFTRDYHDPHKRSIANALSLELLDGTQLGEVLVEYPLGHRRRRKEAMPMLKAKFRDNLARRFPERQQQIILKASMNQSRLEKRPVHEYVDLYVIQP